MNETVETLLDYCSQNQRVCPVPLRWKDLWELLPHRKQVESGWEPALPLILGAWDSPALWKILRLKEHIEWAAQHGVLDKVSDFLRKLPEQDWYHVGE
jgi:hypothetical protein